MSPRRLLLPAVAALALVLGAAGCSSAQTPAESAGSAPAGTSSESSGEAPSSMIILDVRTPAEFAQGHLEGAVNIDIQAGNFTTQLEPLDRHAHYVVYCKSGNRSARAANIMDSSGFTDVTDAGGMPDASATTGIPIVTTD